MKSTIKKIVFAGLCVSCSFSPLFADVPPQSWQWCSSNMHQGLVFWHLAAVMGVFMIAIALLGMWLYCTNNYQSKLETE